MIPNYFAMRLNEPILCSTLPLLGGMYRHTAEQPGCYMHTSSTGILTFEDERAKTCGIQREKVFGDWSVVSELINVPSDDAFHRNVDSSILLGHRQEGTPGSRPWILGCEYWLSRHPLLQP